MGHSGDQIGALVAWMVFGAWKNILAMQALLLVMRRTVDCDQDFPLADFDQNKEKHAR
jgi:hypothetical protein